MGRKATSADPPVRGGPAGGLCRHLSRSAVVGCYNPTFKPAMASEPLTSWKAIAAVFDRDVRTVQRWEKEEGLPVHRHLHNRRHSVWATREELEAWWRHRESQLNLAAAPKPAVGRHRLFAAITCIGATLVAGALLAIRRTATTQAKPAVTTLGSMPGATDVEVQIVRDLNGDEADDLLVQDARAAQIELHFGPRNTVGDPDVRLSAPGRNPAHAVPVGDVDGDGIGDLTVSVMHGEPDTYHGTGPTYLVRGRTSWPARLELPADADSTMYLDSGPDARLASCSAHDGVDLNHDGLPDLVFGGADYSPPGRRSAGGAFVIFGRREWPARINVVQAADVSILGSFAGHGLTALCGAGDINADGLADLAVVADESTLWGLRGRRGSAYVFAGRRSWPALLDAERDALLRLSADSPSAWSAQPRFADVNGDGVADLVTAVVELERPGHGKVAILFGSKQRRGVISEGEADVLIEGDGRFGYGSTAADLDGDGYADLLISEPDNKRLHLIPGRREWRPRGAAEVYSSVVFSRGDASLGGRPLAIGDFDGDNVSDVALSVGARQFGVFRPSLPLHVDVRPNSGPNVLVPGGMVAIAVRLQGPQKEELDVSSLRAAGTAPAHFGWKDDSALLYFSVDTLRLPANATRLALVGRTRRGIPVSGSDSIVIPRPAITSAR